MLWRYFPKILLESSEKNMTLKNDTAIDVLVVGSNSRLWAALSARSDLHPPSVTFHPVSSLDIFDLPPSILQQSFSYAVVFSYSLNFSENIKLLKNLSLVVSNLVYISTCSAVAADMGYPYKYPQTKRAVEIFALDSKLFEGLHIIRLGMVEGTFSPDSLKGRYKYTSLEMIAQRIKGSYFKNSPVVVFENLYIPAEKPFGCRIERLCFAAYRRAILCHPVMGGLLRPLDVVLKALGWHWYGYNCVVNYGPKNH
jgi:hypothetical protein